jgi:hypothetical protein
MLDLATLFLSMGLQEDLKKVRTQYEGQLHQEEETAETPIASALAEHAATAINAVEQAASEVASAMIPTADMMPAMPEVSMPEVDLSLPSSVCTK